MSQFTKPDEDVTRMRQALRQSAQPCQTSSTGDHLMYEIRALGMMRFCTVFFYATSLSALYMAPDTIFTVLEHESFNAEMFFTFVTIFIAVVAMPVLLTMFNKRLVLKMYYSEQRKSYIAMTQSVFLTLKRFEFEREDVVPVIKSGSILSLFSLTTLKARGQPYYVNPYNFKLPSDYNHLMGYDRVH